MRHVVLPPAWRLAVDLINLLSGCLVRPGRRRTALSAFGSTRTVAFTDAMSPADGPARPVSLPGGRVHFTRLQLPAEGDRPRNRHQRSDQQYEPDDRRPHDAPATDRIRSQGIPGEAIEIRRDRLVRRFRPLPRRTGVWIIRHTPMVSPGVSQARPPLQARDCRP